jgi:microcystin degradation protein MlrC
MRVALIHISQETNDFHSLLTTLDDYAAFGLHEGAAVLEKARGHAAIDGWIDAIAESGLPVEWVPIVWGVAGAGGRITTEARQFFLDAIRRNLAPAGPLDAIAVHLHGACSAEGVDDVEGEQLALIRAMRGADIPLLLSLDHHANITKLMVDCADAIVAHRTQPHDPYDTGHVAGHLLARVLRGEIRPVTTYRKLRLITHQEQFLTAAGPMKDWFDQARAMEADPRVLQVSPCPMQPWLDVAEGGWAVTVTTDNDRALAEKLAEDSADFAWARRHAFMEQTAVPIDEAVRLADAENRGVVVLSDTGDTVFGGTAGDSNLILESILRQGIAGKALIPLISPENVAALVTAGEGATVTVELGATAATEFFKPLKVTGTVKKIAPGRVHIPVFTRAHFDQGTTVIFEAGPVTLFITERRGTAGNVPDTYRAFGIEPAEYKMAVLKTASNFQYFAPITSRVIRVDTSGPGQSNVKGLPWKRVPRPIFPMEEVASWRG